MNKIQVSVVVPIYNVEKYLEQCLESLAHQTLKNIEIICVNDGSTDNSLNIIKKYVNKYNNFKLIDKKNGGYGSAVNVGIAASSAPYIGIVEPDDFVSEQMYEILYSKIKTDSNLDIVKAGYWDYIGENAKKTSMSEKLRKKLDSTITFNINELPEILKIHPSIWSCLYKKSFLNKYNIKMLEVKGAGWVDNPFFYETFIQAKKICYIPTPVYYYRQFHEGSSSISISPSIPIARMNDIFDILQKKNITNKLIIMEAYNRALLYITKIKENGKLSVKSLYSIKKLLNRMDKNVVKSLSSTYIYDKYKKIRIKHIFVIMFSNKKWFPRVYRIYKSMSSKKAKLKTRIKKYITKNKTIKLPEKKSTRILVLPSDNCRTSGAFLSMITLNKILKEKYNLDVFVVLPNPGNGESLLEENNIPYTLIPSKDWVIPVDQIKDKKYFNEIKNKKKLNKIAIKKLTKLIRKNDFDIVHINTTYSYVGAIAAKKAKVPLVWHLREFLEEDQSKTLWDRKKGNKLINKSQKVIAISKSIYNKYANIIDSNKLVCILNGIDSEKFYKPNKQIFQNNKTRFIFLGAILEYKGQIEFAKACALLKKDGYDFEICFIGTWHDSVKKQVEQILNEAGINNDAKFLGYKKDVYNYLEQSDISFTCAKSEAFGRTTVEAMLTGNLVIGANTAGTSELITSEKTRIII